MLSRVCDLQHDIVTFIRQKNLPGADHFSNPQWLARLVLLTYITTHLNYLSVKLQGKNILVTDMYSHITTLEVKLPLWEAQLTAGQFMHFPPSVACAPDDVDLNTCVGVFTSAGGICPPFHKRQATMLRVSSCSPSPSTCP